MTTNQTKEEWDLINDYLKDIGCVVCKNLTDDDAMCQCRNKKEFIIEFSHNVISENFVPKSALKEAEQRVIKEFIEKLMVETSPGKPLSVIECIDSMRSKYQVND